MNMQHVTEVILWKPATLSYFQILSSKIQSCRVHDALEIIYSVVFSACLLADNAYSL